MEREVRKHAGSSGIDAPPRFPFFSPFPALTMPSLPLPVKKLLGPPVRWLIRQGGYELRRPGPRYPLDYRPDEIDTIEAVKRHTLTPHERIVALTRAVEHLVEHHIPGDIVECGVWRGGSVMAVARTLLRLGDTQRHLWLYDTFAGMTEPGADDVSLLNESAADQYRTFERWCYASLEDVRAAVLSTGYDPARVHFIVGKVEETLPGTMPEHISLLRLDTDWYSSTFHELEHLFPRLASGGVLLLDDYGHWQGSRKAVDEYLQRLGIPLLLQRIDYAARIAVKP